MPDDIIFFYCRSNQSNGFLSSIDSAGESWIIQINGSGDTGSSTVPKIRDQ